MPSPLSKQLAAVLETHLSDVLTNVGRVTFGYNSPGGYTLFRMVCEDTPDNLAVTLRYLEGHPFIMGAEYARGHFNFYVQTAWINKLGGKYGQTKRGAAPVSDEL